MKKKLLFIIPSIIIIGVVILLVLRQRESKPQIAFILKNLENPFFTEIKLGAESFIQENNLKEYYNFDFKSGTSEKDLETPKSLIKSYIARDYDIICITPTSSRELNDDISEALDNGIKVLIVDTKIDTTNSYGSLHNLSCYIGSNNEYGGKLAAEYIIKKSNFDNPKILFFEGVPDQETAQMRKKGFFEYLAKNNVSVVETYLSNWNKQEAYEIMNNTIARGVSFNSIFCSNDEMAIGVIDALERNNLNPQNYCIVGFDAIPESITLIKQKKLRATIRQMPNEMGRKAIEISNQLLKGLSIKYSNEIQVELIN